MNKNEVEVVIGEYQEIHRLRELWSKAIMGWVRIGLPVGAGLFGFFSYMATSNHQPYLSMAGWVVFVTPMILWRVVVYCHIDRQIVGMYPRMLELEQKLKWETNSSYIYNNLSEQGKKSLAGKLNIVVAALEKMNFRQYAEAARKTTSTDDAPYQLLLEVLSQFRRGAVSDRGHNLQNVAAIIIGIATLIFALFVAFA